MPVRPRVRIRTEHPQHVQDTLQLELPGRLAVLPSLHRYLAALGRAALHTESHLHDMVNGRTRGR